MANFIYCSACGQKSLIHRKALPHFGQIIDVIEPHVCTEEVQELDLKPVNFPNQPLKGEDNKFVDYLNGLKPAEKHGPFEVIGDRRPKDQVKSSAPDSIIANIKSLQNLTPSQDVQGPSLDPDESEE